MALCLLLLGFLPVVASAQQGGGAPFLPNDIPYNPYENKGVQRGLVIFADFEGGDGAAPQWARGLFELELEGSFSNFYHTMSLGQFHIGGEVAPRRYGAAEPASNYLATDAVTWGEFGRFSLEILRRGDGDIDFSRFDSDGPDGLPDSGDDDGVVDALFLVLPRVPANFLLGPATGIAHLGFEAEFLTDDVGAGGAPIRIAATKGSILQGRDFAETVAVMCHEYGHVLGLPDLFDVDFLRQAKSDPAQDSAGIGAWGLMGWGTAGWTPGSGPNSFSAWSRLSLGWARVEEVTTSGPLVVEDVGLSGKVYKVPLTVREYFLLEYRRRSSSYYDRQNPAEGLLVWHVENILPTEDAPGRISVDLECADGLFTDAGFPLGRRADPVGGGDNLDFWAHDSDYARAHQGNFGDATDPFDGVRYTDFTPASNPASLSNDGDRSIALRKIRIGDGQVSLEVETVPVLVEFDNPRVADASGDGILMAGEEGRMLFRVLNQGTFTLEEVRIELAAADPLVRVIQAEARFRTIRAGSRSEGGGEVGFPRLRFEEEFVGSRQSKLVLRAYIGESLVSAREVEAVGVAHRQKLKSFVVADGRDGDGQLQAGEFFRLNLQLEGALPRQLAGLHFSLRSLDAGARAVAGNGVFFGLESPLESRRTPEFLLEAGLAAGRVLQFEFTAASPFGAWRDTLVLPVAPGRDRTPPRVGAMQVEASTARVGVSLAESTVLEGGQIQRAWAQFFAAADSSDVLAEIPLRTDGVQYEGEWGRRLAPGRYLVRGFFIDQEGNIGQSSLQAFTVVEMTRADGADNGWETLDLPAAGYAPAVTALAFAPLDQQLVYAATQHGLWRSRDSGSSWRRGGLMLGGNRVGKIAVDRWDAAELYCELGGVVPFGSQPRVLLHSIDAGLSWRRLDHPAFYAGQWELDPLVPGRIYGAGPEGLFVSGDSGATWRALPAAGPVTLVRLSPQGGGLYAGRLQVYAPELEVSVPGALAHSADGGHTWSQYPLEHRFDDLQVEPRREAGLLATGGDTLWTSADHGATWSVLALLPQAGPWALRVHPVQEGLLVAWRSQQNDTLIRSWDGGLSWESIEPVAIPFGVYLEPGRPQRLWAVAQRGLFVTGEDGGGWQLAALRAAGVVGTVYLQPGGGLIVGGASRTAAGQSLPGTLRLERGQPWVWQPEAVATGFGANPIELLLGDPAQKDLLFAFTALSGYNFGGLNYVNGGVLLRSEDGGQRWQELPLTRGFPTGNGGGPDIVPDPFSAGRYYAVVPSRGLFLSADHGSSWQGFGQGLSDTPWRTAAFAADPGVKGRLYGAVGSQIWGSGDGGQSWERLSQVEGRAPLVQLVFDPLDGARLFAVSAEGVQVSVDRGQSWAELLHLAWREPHRMRLRFDPVDADRLLLVTGPTLLDSRDGGQTWKDIGSGLAAKPWFADAAVDPAAPEVLYAATPWGVFRRKSVASAVVGPEVRVPQGTRLEANFPNPFNPATAIPYHLAQAARVRLAVYNSLGQEIRVLVEGDRGAGGHQILWDGNDKGGQPAASGVYFYRLQVRAGPMVTAQTRKLVLLR